VEAKEARSSLLTPFSRIVKGKGLREWSSRRGRRIRGVARVAVANTARASTVRPLGHLDRLVVAVGEPREVVGKAIAVMGVVPQVVLRGGEGMLSR
jgi:hypothetical protein